MSLLAGFAQTDITPPLGCGIVGWLADRQATSIRDPLFARVAVLDSGGTRLAIVQLDVLSVDRADTDALRRKLAPLGFAPEAVVVSTTHTHSGPATCGAGDRLIEAGYTAELFDRLPALVGAAVEALEPAEFGFGWGYESTIAHCRRVILRDGTVRTHGRFSQPDALCLESPIDPEVAVLALRRPGGGLLGVLVNYACHPTHHGHDGAISADFPGAMARILGERGCPVALYLQGAAGDMHFARPLTSDSGEPLDQQGERLADVVGGVIESVEWRADVTLRAAARELALPYRDPTPEEIAGTVRGAQRFVDPAIYDRMIPALVERIRAEGTKAAEVQVLSIDEIDLCATPGELFSVLGLALKQAAWPRHALALAYCNDWIGYIPHREAFARGGYETTFLQSSCLAPGAGEKIVDAWLALLP